MSKILIIEENQKVSDIIGRFLEKRGHVTVIAPDGISAMRSFVADAFDLLLVNMELQLLSGDEVCRKIRESAKGKDIPIILMSGALKNEARIEALKQELRLAGFLTKPFTSDMLSFVLASALPAPAPDSSQAPLQEQETRQSEAPPSEPVAEPASSAAPVEDKAGPADFGTQLGQQPAPAASRLPPPLKGNLEASPFEKVLFYLFKKRGTGTLTVTRDDLIRTFFFMDGGVVDLDLVPEDNDFGSYLSAKGLIDGVELREYQERRKRDNVDARDLFIKMGCLSPRQFLDESRNFLYDRLLECFTWKTGTVLFEWSPPVMSVYPVAPAFMPLVFYRGFKTKLIPEEIGSFLEGKSSLHAVRAPEFYEYQNHLAGEAAVAEVLDVIDGARTCRNIIGSLDENEAGLILYTLDYLNLVIFSDKPQADVTPPFPIRERARKQPAKETETFEDLGGELSALSDQIDTFEAVKAAAPEEARPGQAALSPLEQDLKDKWEAVKDNNYYAMFGMTPKTFTFDKLKKGYFEYTRTYGPDKFFASSSDIMNLAEELLSRISNAYETLSNVVSKENYDEMLSQKEEVPSAGDDKEFYEQIQFQSGKVFVEQGQYASAEKSFMNCLNIDPNKPEYLAYLALAVYNNPAHKGNPAEKKRAKDLVNKSLQLGKLSIAYALKGTIYLDEGGLNFAEAEFNKALKLNPNNKTALKKLAEIKAKRDEEKKGLFQRMFK